MLVILNIDMEAEMQLFDRLIRISAVTILAFAVAAGPVVLSARTENTQSKVSEAKKSKSDKSEKKDKKNKGQDIVIHNEVVVTATRTESTVFNSPKPVAVVSKKKIREKAPNNISELLPEMPGTDMVGIGANQSRPVIRGLRGQRILLLSDGIRMSNARRTQAFGEIPSLVDVSGIERVEVVRGPASVLYGSEAIGGVINILTLAPDYGRGSRINGQAGYRYSSADQQNKAFANLSGGIGGFGFMLSGSYRKGSDYSAPAGTFGNINLARDTPVLDSGIKDNNLNLLLGYRFGDGSDVSFRYETYSASNAGFGYIDPAAYSAGDPTIQLLYPKQDLHKFSLKYENRSLRFALADGLSITAYRIQNNRVFNTNIEIPFYPGAGVVINSSNTTDVSTFGARLELTKVLFSTHVLTYGLDYYQDISDNTDLNTTEYYGFGPPMVSSDPFSKVPNAFFQSAGLFLQDQISLFDKTALILGVRYQSVSAKTRETAGISDPLVESRDSTFVGAANLIQGITDDLKLVFSLGRGFRSANIPERFYQGVTPDGSGFQIRNTGLKPESSFNMDFGVRYRLGGLYLEGSVFRNQVYDGIQIAATGSMIGRLKEYRNVNIDKLRIQGVELLGQYSFEFGLSLLASYSRLASKNLTNLELMNADTYGSRLNLNVRYAFSGNPFWVEYHIRINGDRKDIDLGDNPIGPFIPGFTVHSLRAGVTLFKNSAFPQQVGVVIGNLTNVLYSEFSNASFFRPAPKRHVIFTWSSRF
jgi:hemoglobin/transferrin/lactoferrin receptor protein